MLNVAGSHPATMYLNGVCHHVHKVHLDGSLVYHKGMGFVAIAIVVS